ncbi:vitamin D 25-hydroxylase-like [Haemaphysalis longicornis]
MGLTGAVIFSVVFAPLLWFALQYVLGLLLRRQLPPGARLPPIPPASSLWGHVEVQTFNFFKTKALEWARMCGPVYRLKLNGSSMVVLNDFNSVKKFLNTKEILNRARSFEVRPEYFQGVGDLNGEPWNANKRFCMTMLRDLGFAKTTMEDKMMEEFSYLDEKIRKTNEAPIHIKDYIQYCTSSNIASFFYARRLPTDHPSRQELQKLITDVVTSIQTVPMLLFCPRPLLWIMSRLPFTKVGQLKAALTALETFTEKQILDYKADGGADINQDFIHGYLKKIEETQQDPRSLFTHRYLVGNVNVFIIAGTMSTTLTMWWLLLVFAKHPDTIQARIQREIDEVVGSDRRPTWEDRKQLPFTRACIWEVERWKTASPLGLARESSEDVVIDGYFIPKGTTVIPNFWACHNDPARWKDPQKYNPQRFLNEDGDIVSQKPEQLIPFSLGRRSCPGEMFASMEVFLMVAFLLQKYNVVPEHPIQCDMDNPDILVPKQVNVRLRFLPRKPSKVGGPLAPTV